MTMRPNATLSNATEAENLLGANLPSRRDEAWKWSDLRKAVSEKAGGLAKSLTPHIQCSTAVRVGVAAMADGLGTPMSSIAQSISAEEIGLHVPDGHALSEPIIISELSSGHARIALSLGEGASAHLIEHHRAASGSFTNYALNITLSKGAKLTRTILHDDPDNATRIATANCVMEQGAELAQFTLSFGAALARLETRVTAKGADVSALINGAYLLSGKRHCDMTSHITLQDQGANIRQSVKGIADEKSRGVFQGKFHVERAAQHTDAEMRHDALMLSETAQIRSKPELEIYADDVACAHGNTIGQLDESALFYMRQRGIPLKAARALLMQAFVNDVFDDMDDEDLQADILAQISAWLEA